MLSSLSIKQKLLGLTFVGVIACTLVAISCFLNLEKLNNAMNQIVVNSQILRNHMFADMLHDTLNSDVNAALLFAKTNNPGKINQVAAELAEHSAQFNEALEKNQQLVTDPKTKETLAKTLPILKNYIASAKDIVNTAKGDGDAGLNKLEDFHKVFTLLEGQMESLTELIEDDVKNKQDKAVQEKTNSAIQLGIIFIISVALSVVISLLVIKSITQPLAGLIQVSDRVADGDLTVKFDTSLNDEIGLLARAMEKMRSKLMSAISQIRQTTDNLQVSVEQIGDISGQSFKNMVQQRSETDLVATAMNQMTATVYEVAKNIGTAANSAQKAAEETEVGGKVLHEAIASIVDLAKQIQEASAIINRLETNSHQISSVLDVIRNIAEQTNLLALNAAIEAARAGEQGRGFAVVADEVRTLASRTQESTGEINEMINRLQTESKLSVEAMTKSCDQAQLVVEKTEKASGSLNIIASTVNNISQLSAQIATAAEEQTAVSEEINRNILHINDAAEVTASIGDKTKDTVTQLESVFHNLQKLVNQFRI